MPTNRKPVRRWPKGAITPAAVAAYRRLLEAQDIEHTCPDPDDCPYFGPVFDSSDRECMKRYEQYELRRKAYDAACAGCEGCAAEAKAEAEVMAALKVTLRLWEMGLDDLPDIVRELEAAVAAA